MIGKMQQRRKWCHSGTFVLAVYITLLHTSNAAMSMPGCHSCPLADPAPGPSAESPAPASSPAAQSPDTDFGSADSPVPASSPGAQSRDTDYGSADSPAPAPSPDALSPDTDSGSADSPAPAPSQDALSPDTDSGSADSPAPAPSPDDPSPDTDYSGSTDSPAPAPIPTAKPPETRSGTQGGVFDVMVHGAKNDGKTDNRLAFIETWNAACDHAGSSTFYIPEGKFFVGPITFAGPCYNNQSPLVNISGNLLAPTNVNAFPNSGWIEFKNLNGIVFTGVIGAVRLDAQGAVEAWKDPSCHESARCKNLITSLKFTNVSNGIISDIAVANSKGFHIGFHGSSNITAQNIIVTAPWDSPNTDGIHISSSSNITIASSKIGVGDDCISIGAGSLNISVSDVSCGPGHGISIGSLGKYPNEGEVKGIKVQNSTINGTQNGIRVKTWPSGQASNASDITFQNIVMINVSNPIIIDQEYCPSHSCNKSEPSSVKLRDIHVKNISGTYNTDFAVSLICSSALPCENIKLADINLNPMTPESLDQGHFNMKGAVNGLQVLSSIF